MPPTLSALSEDPAQLCLNHKEIIRTLDDGGGRIFFPSANLC